MKTLKALIVVLISSMALGGLQGQSVLALLEDTSDEGCGSGTNCDNNIVCFNIQLIPAVTADLQSYNIWLQYSGSGMHYLSDSACITDDGNDNNLDATHLSYRVAGVDGNTVVMAGVPVIIHNVCFTFTSTDSLNGSEISVGGTPLGGVFSTLTFDDPPSNEPDVPEFPLLLDGGSVSCLEILPLGLLSFDAHKEGTTAILEWYTVHEQGKQFEIERSDNGTTFGGLGHLASSGVEGSLQSFSFVDRLPAPGTNYYRIREVKKDGSSDFSPIRTVTFDITSSFVRVWPNPVVQRELNVDVINPEGAETEIRLVSISGTEVFYRKFFAAEFHERLDMVAMAPGVYSLIVQSVHGTYTDKVVILE